MGIVLRYFNDDSVLVEIKYFYPAYLTQTNSKNLHDKLLKVLSTIDLRKMIQISMDGLNINWDVLKIYSKI